MLKRRMIPSMINLEPRFNLSDLTPIALAVGNPLVPMTPTTPVSTAPIATPPLTTPAWQFAVADVPTDALAGYTVTPVMITLSGGILIEGAVATPNPGTTSSPMIVVPTGTANPANGTTWNFFYPDLPGHPTVPSQSGILMSSGGNAVGIVTAYDPGNTGPVITEPVPPPPMIPLDPNAPYADPIIPPPIMYPATP